MLVRDAGETSMESRKPSRRSSMIEIVEKMAENNTVNTSAPAKKRPRSPEPEPINSQNTSGDATTPSTRLFCRQKRTNSRCHRVTTGSQKLLNQSSCFVYKHIFQSRLMQPDRIDGAGESLHYLGNEAVAISDLHAEHAIDDGRLQAEAGFDPAAQGGGVGALGRLHHYYISADARAQVRGRALGHHAALMQQRQPVATVGFNQNVGRQQYGNAFTAAQFFH